MKKLFIRFNLHMFLTHHRVIKIDRISQMLQLYYILYCVDLLSDSTRLVANN